MNLASAAVWIVDHRNLCILSKVVEVCGAGKEEKKLLGVIATQKRNGEVRRAIVDGRSIDVVPDFAARIFG